MVLCASYSFGISPLEEGGGEEEEEEEKEEEMRVVQAAEVAGRLQRRVQVDAALCMHCLRSSLGCDIYIYVCVSMCDGRCVVFREGVVMGVRRRT